MIWVNGLLIVGGVAVTIVEVVAVAYWIWREIACAPRQQAPVGADATGMQFGQRGDDAHRMR